MGLRGHSATVYLTNSSCTVCLCSGKVRSHEQDTRDGIMPFVLLTLFICAFWHNLACIVFQMGAEKTVVDLAHFARYTCFGFGLSSLSFYFPWKLSSSCAKIWFVIFDFVVKNQQRMEVARILPC